MRDALEWVVLVTDFKPYAACHNALSPAPLNVHDSLQQVLPFHQRTYVCA